MPYIFPPIIIVVSSSSCLIEFKKEGALCCAVSPSCPGYHALSSSSLLIPSSPPVRYLLLGLEIRDLSMPHSILPRLTLFVIPLLPPPSPHPHAPATLDGFVLQEQMFNLQIPEGPKEREGAPPYILPLLTCVCAFHCRTGATKAGQKGMNLFHPEDCPVLAVYYNATGTCLLPARAAIHGCWCFLLCRRYNTTCVGVNWRTAIPPVLSAPIIPCFTESSSAALT